MEEIVFDYGHTNYQPRVADDDDNRGRGGSRGRSDRGRGRGRGFRERGRGRGRGRGTRGQIRGQGQGGHWVNALHERVEPVPDRNDEHVNLFSPPLPSSRQEYRHNFTDGDQNERVRHPSSSRDRDRANFRQEEDNFRRADFRGNENNVWGNDNNNGWNENNFRGEETNFRGRGNGYRGNNANRRRPFDSRRSRGGRGTTAYSYQGTENRRDYYGDRSESRDRNLSAERHQPNYNQNQNDRNFRDCPSNYRGRGGRVRNRGSEARGRGYNSVERFGQRNANSRVAEPREGRYRGNRPYHESVPRERSNSNDRKSDDGGHSRRPIHEDIEDTIIRSSNSALSIPASSTTLPVSLSSLDNQSHVNDVGVGAELRDSDRPPVPCDITHLPEPLPREGQSENSTVNAVGNQEMALQNAAATNTTSLGNCSVSSTTPSAEPLRNPDSQGQGVNDGNVEEILIESDTGSDNPNEFENDNHSEALSDTDEVANNWADDRVSAPELFSPAQNEGFSVEIEENAASTSPLSTTSETRPGNCTVSTTTPSVESFRNSERQGQRINHENREEILIESDSGSENDNHLETLNDTGSENDNPIEALNETDEVNDSSDDRISESESFGSHQNEESIVEIHVTSTSPSTLDSSPQSLASQDGIVANAPEEINTSGEQPTDAEDSDVQPSEVDRRSDDDSNSESELQPMISDQAELLHSPVEIEANSSLEENGNGESDVSQTSSNRTLICSPSSSVSSSPTQRQIELDEHNPFQQDVVTATSNDRFFPFTGDQSSSNSFNNVINNRNTCELNTPPRPSFYSPVSSPDRSPPRLDTSTETEVISSNSVYLAPLSTPPGLNSASVTEEVVQPSEPELQMSQQSPVIISTPACEPSTGLTAPPSLSHEENTFNGAPSVSETLHVYVSNNPPPPVENVSQSQDVLHTTPRPIYATIRNTTAPLVITLDDESDEPNLPGVSTFPARNELSLTPTALAASTIGIDDRTTATEEELKTKSKAISLAMGAAMKQLKAARSVSDKITAFKNLRGTVLKASCVLDAINIKLEVDHVLTKGIPDSDKFAGALQIGAEEMVNYFLKILAIVYYLREPACTNWKPNLTLLHYRLSRLLNYYVVGASNEETDINWVNINLAIYPRFTQYRIPIDEVNSLWNHIRAFHIHTKVDKNLVLFEQSELGLKGFSKQVDTIVCNVRGAVYRRKKVDAPPQDSAAQNYSFENDMKILLEIRGGQFN